MKKAEYFFFFFLLIIFFNYKILCESNNNNNKGNGFNENRVLGGNATDPNMFKFVTSFRRIFHEFSEELNVTKLSDAFFCSSSIISKRHVLTSAHCVTRLPKFIDGSKIVVFEEVPFVLLDLRPRDDFVYDSNVNQNVFSISNFAIASQIHIYDVRFAVSSNMDLAIIEFPEYTDFNIDPVLLAKDYEERDGDIGIIAGYGEYKSDGNGKQISKFPSDIRHAYIPIAPHDSCVNACIIRAGIANLTTSGGDSGGPLMVERNGNFYQIGITSAGDNSDELGNAWFARISLYCDWIENITKNEAKCHSLTEVITTPLPSTTTAFYQKTTIPPPKQKSTTNKIPVEIYPQIKDGTTKENNNKTMIEFNMYLLFICVLFTFF